ncbi:MULTISPECIES: LURP-one-related/scramblase family protein [unclassified Streptomyces]|uniref:LURP-one-related/scramblase family protein n=1 Tax=unclassified Streptomyces TaxID=2593676 RepID=UPI0006ADD4F8|nr:MULTISPECIES: LURP-one-related family protein [unclassified Streptomyces]
MKYLVRDKIFAIGDDYWIEDEHGRHAFLADGKAMRLRDTLELKDPDGRVLITLRQKMFSLRDTMTIERDERPLATVRRKRLSLLRNHYRVTLVEGTELDVSGRILDREFTVEYEGELLVHVSRQWLRVRDTYAVNVVREDADAALMVAVAVCVIRMAERERED